MFYILWGSNKEKVKRKTVTGSMECGGLKMCNLENQIAALKIKWLTRR